MILKIRITDFNDNSPIFEKTSAGNNMYSVTLHESQTTVGTLVYQCWYISNRVIH